MAICSKVRSGASFGLCRRGNYCAVQGLVLRGSLPALGAEFCFFGWFHGAVLGFAEGAMMPAIAPQGGHGYQRKYWERAGRAEENELEEGEACDYMDDPNYDPDVAFSYLDEKLHDVLGHFQKDFEGGVCADKLGAKFGCYGSFLPSQERSPLVLLEPKTPLLRNDNMQKLSSEGPVECMHHVTTDPLSATPPTEPQSSALNSIMPGAAASANHVYMKETVNDVNGNRDNFSWRKKSVDKDVPGSDKKKYRLCFKVSSDSASYSKYTATYSGLGLEHSSSSSFEDTPNEDTIEISPDVGHSLARSPLSLIQLMTEHQIPGGSLLTPLPESLLQLSEPKNENATKDCEEGMMAAQIEGEPLTNKNEYLFVEQLHGMKEGIDRPCEKNEKMELKKESDSELASKVPTKFREGMEGNSRTAEERGPNILKPQPKSFLREDSQERPEREIAEDTGKEKLEGLHQTKKVAKIPMKSKGLTSDLPEVKHNEADRNRELCNSGKAEMQLLTDAGSKPFIEKGQRRCNEGRKESSHGNALSDKRKMGKETIMHRKKPGKETSGQRDSTNASKAMATGQVVTREAVGIIQDHRKVSEKKRQKDIDKDIHTFKDIFKESSRDAVKKGCKESRKDESKKEPLPTATTKKSAKGFHRDSAKDSRKEQMEHRKDSFSICQKDILKESASEHLEKEHLRVTKREKLRRHGVSKDSALEIVEHASTGQAKPSNAIIVPQPLLGDTMVTDAGLVPAAPVVVNDNWVCCDECEKWRLLPFGVETSSLPKKWLCRMLDWLPGMNCCDVSEDETTQALYALYGVQPIQGQSDINQGQAQPLAVSAHVPNARPIQQTQEAKPCNFSKSCNTRKGYAQKSMPAVPGTTKLTSSLLVKNERKYVKNGSLNNSVRLPVERVQGNVGISLRADEGNNVVLKGNKDKQKEKGKLNQAAAGCDDAPSLKLKRKTQDELRCEFVKKAKADDVKSPIGDFLQDANVNDKVDCRNSVVVVRSLGYSSKQLKHSSTPKQFRNKMRKEESLAADRFKDQQLASTEMDSDKNDYLAKKRKIREWEGETSQHDLPERGHISMKEEYATEYRMHNETQNIKAEGMEHSARNTDGKGERKGRVTRTLISSNQDPLPGEIEVQRRGDSLKKHGVHRSQVQGASQRVSDATKTLKRNTGFQQSFACAISSSSKVEVQGSPVESVSSLPPRTTKLEIMASNTRNGSGLDVLDINCLQSHNSRRCFDDGDTQRVCSGLVGKAKMRNEGPPGSSENCVRVQSPLHNTGRFIQDSSKRETMQLSDGKAKDSDFCNGRIDTEHGDNSTVNGSKLSQRRQRISDEKKEQIRIQEKHGNCNLMDDCSQRRGGREKLLTDRKELSDDMTTYTTDKDKRKDMIFNGKCNLKLNPSGERKGQNQLGKNSDGRTHLPSFDSDAKQKVGSFSSRGRVQALQHRDGEMSLQKAPSNERTSDQVLSDSNIQAETASARTESHIFLHYDDMPAEQGHGSGAGSMLNKTTQLEGLVFDASSAVSSRVLRESSNGDNLHGILSCSLKPTQSTGFSIIDPEGSVASPVRKDYGLGAANAALKEAKHLKHSADRLKNTGVDELESTDLYFRAALKFLHTASLFELCNANTANHGETSQSMTIYTSTASLCEFCAVTYERNKEMAAAALAYKCMGVAHMRVLVAKNTCRSRDWHELQTVSEMAIPGESPLSSPASVVDNLNNSAVVEKDLSMNPAKSLELPHVAGNPVIIGRHRPHLMRILQYVQDANAAIEAFQKAEYAFAASNASFTGNYSPEGIFAVKRVINFHFHDVDELLRLVRLAMEAINH